MHCYQILPNKEPIRATIQLNEFKNRITNFNNRDFYFFDNKNIFDISSLTIKENCIICKFDNIKAIVFIDDAFIISEIINIKEIINYNNNIFHINILEFLLSSVIIILENESNQFYSKYTHLKNKFIIDTNFITLQSNLINLEYRIKELHTITVNLIKNKTDLKMLTFNKIDEYQLEQLIENYNLKIEDIYNDTLKLIKEMDNIHKVTSIKLSEDRNKYALINLYISFISLGFSFGSFIGSIFGMNLKNNLENSSISFILVIILTLTFMIFIILFQFRLLNNTE